MTDTRVNITERLLTPPEAAELLGIAPQTLANWRSMGKGPRFVRVGSRSVRYRLSDLLAYVESLETVAAVAA
ncbi:helix-turn-helix transcriptional regulator [Brachybacterium paraconglomeratum]|uniref:helix-turn-helix transcriptional regulator n=1 Tax=Brachybacterium paraconglomeratum TaxID=173362 RepID=UPI003513709D